MGEMQKCWIAVACAAHVRRGIEGGFMQVCHGKGGPLKRIRPGDGVAYYSPTEAMGDRSPLRAFTAIGIAANRGPYQADMGNGFTPFRRDMRWAPSRQALIQPLLNELAFSAQNHNWGYQLRFGLFEVDPADLRRIAHAMGVTDMEAALKPGSERAAHRVALVGAKNAYLF